jgi:hypothetical protein
MPENNDLIDPGELAKSILATSPPSTSPPTVLNGYNHCPTPLQVFIEKYALARASSKNDSEPSVRSEPGVLVHAAKQLFITIYPDYKDPV